MSQVEEKANSNDPYLMLTASGTLHAFANEVPDDVCRHLQSLLPRGGAWRLSDWLHDQPGREEILKQAKAVGWVHESRRELRAPDVRLDNYLPHAIAGLSGTRKAALASNDGFCLARVGFSQDEADTLCVAAADFFSFLDRQKQRGWSVTGRSVSFFEGIDMLLPMTSFVLFWVDGIGYWLIIGDEPLINNTALVEIVWGIRSAGEKFLVR